MRAKPDPDRVTLVDILADRAIRSADATAFEFAADDGAESPVSYAELDASARTVAAALRDRCAPGARVLIIYPPGAGFVTGFLGCLYAGVVAVPAYPPMTRRGAERALAIAADADASLALSDGPTATGLLASYEEIGTRGLDWLRTDEISPQAQGIAGPGPRPDQLALLQYTSGSTGIPKGVMVTHANLIANSTSIGRALGLGPDSRGVSWLPPYHDLGLIGGIIQPIFAGFPCTLLSPLSFLRRPACWLEAISRHGATISAAPDFGYLECSLRVSPEELAGLDLSRWRHALVGAEPVRAATLAEFARAFAGSGFRHSAFYPCYGLAEATLFVSGPGQQASRPSTLGVDRAGLARGLARPAGPHDGSATTVVTGLGRAHGDDQVLVVDPQTRQRCRPRTIGEVWVTGPSVAQGYWQREAESARAFGAHLAGTRSPAYLRTGDLGFMHRSGLFVTGRIKDLMVIRGRNHYPSDLEDTAGRSHPKLKPARAAAFTVDDGSQELAVLVHEVVKGFGPDDAAAVVKAIQAAMSTEHGLRLHEIVLVRPGSIPRTTSGKIMRSGCRDKWLAGSLATVHSSQGGPARGMATEPSPQQSGDRSAPAALARIIAQGLGLWPVPVPDDVPLVSLGLDSLRSVSLASALADAFSLELSVPELLSGVTMADLRARLGPPASAASASASADGDGDGDGGQVAGRAAGEEVGQGTWAAPAQQALWLLDQLGAGDAYHILASVRLRGPLDPGVLGQCLDELVRQHQALRTCFAPAADGSLHTIARPAASLPLDILDLRGAGGQADREERAKAEAERLAQAPFDLASGPLLRLVLICLTDDHWELVACAHHIALDGWSLSILTRQLGECYRAAKAGRPMPALAIAPGPQHRRTRADDDDDEAFWRRTLAGAHAVALPVGPRPPAAPSWRGASLPLTLPAATYARVRAFGAASGATPFMVVLAGLAAALARWSGQDDIVIGTPAACRDRPGTAGLVGLLVNTMPIRIGLAGNPSFAALLARVSAGCLAAYPHQALPFGRILKAAGARPAGARAPLVRVLLAMQNVPSSQWRAAGVQAEATELPTPGAQFELALHLRERPDGSLRGHASYAADLLDPATVRGVLDSLAQILRHACATPGLPVADLPALTSAEHEEIVTGLSGSLAEPLGHGLVADLVGARADRAPSAQAVVAGQQVLSYGELEENANKLAWHLRDQGVRAERPVAVCLGRSAALLVALLAVLRSGGAYVPLDPSYPASRLAHLLADTRPAVVLTSADLADLVTESAARAGVGAGRLICLDDQAGGFDGYLSTRPAGVADPLGIACIIHTSGSTGRPKGVLSTHAGLANRLAWMQRAFPLEAGEAVLHKTPVGFDVSGWELFWPLIAGGTVVMARPDGHRDPLYLSRLIRERAVTTCHFVPSMLRAFLADPASASCAATLRRVICSGEELPPDLAARFFAALPGVELHNLYGPTEAAIDVTAHAVAEAEVAGGRVPIGRPIAGARLQVLDQRGHPVPRLVEGELHIGGIPLARGYLGQAGLTAERFVPDPFTPGARLYRTGDRARWLGDGSLDYLGRLDRQVKIRGQRIEPAEVESALAGDPRVAAAAVDVRQGPDGEPRLVAYVVPASAQPPTGPQLRGYLAERLPGPMVPAAFVSVDQLPVGPNGKLSRAQLPDPTGPFASAEQIAPRDQSERWLAAVWQETLGREQVSVTDDFFDLGGDSLLATRIVTRIRFAYGVELPVGEFLSGALTIESLACSLREHQVSVATEHDLSEAVAWLDGLSDAEVSRLLAQAENDGTSEVT
ncbi:MAG TPA: amino acid adenylation domain-containing protein [Streptosporangiaceae bacterium]|nr:amino acid adenylation domain-containing protein [Streptosporangiaceae bacterium]